MQSNSVLPLHDSSRRPIHSFIAFTSRRVSSTSNAGTQVIINVNKASTIFDVDSCLNETNLKGN